MTPTLNKLILVEKKQVCFGNTELLLGASEAQILDTQSGHNHLDNDKLIVWRTIRNNFLDWMYWQDYSFSVFGERNLQPLRFSPLVSAKFFTIVSNFSQFD